MSPAKKRKTKASVYRYRWKWLKNKSMRVALLWSSTCCFVLCFIILKYLHYATIRSVWHASISLIMGVALPFKGLITDAYVGRYRCIKSSLNLLFIGTTFITLFEVMSTFLHSNYCKVLATIAISISIFGFFGVQSNIVQFCLDQLVDASRDEIVSFVGVYVWSLFSASLTIGLLEYGISFLSGHDNAYDTVSYIALPILLAICLCCDVLCHQVLVKEPVSHNPLKLIFRVLKYAAKTKYPRLRSSFTYWEDKPYSRIDLGKEKYGGPFTVEQVEDVKTFFRMAILIGVGALFFAIVGVSESLLFIVFKTNLNHGSSAEISENFFSPQIFVLLNAGFIVVLLVAPIYELTVYRVCRRCLQRLTILSRVLLGMVLMLLALLLFTVFILARSFHIISSGNCTLSDSPSPVGSVAYLYGISGAVDGLGKFIFIIAGTEFICAQAPYSMKGLLFGYTYSCVSMGTSLISAILVFSFPTLTDSFDKVHVECLVWHLLSCSILGSIVLVLYWVISCFYKKRLREDTLPSQHYFAEQYYSSIYDVTDSE